MIATIQFAGLTVVENLASLDAVCNYATPSGEARVQSYQPLRATWQKHVARGGAVTRLPIQITFTDADDDEAFARLHDYLGQILTNNQQGDLVITHLGGAIRTYEDAVFVRYGPQGQTGCTNVMVLEFIAGPCTETEGLTVGGDFITITL